MDFGRIDEHELNKINFALPPEPNHNQHLLNKPREGQPRLYVGCAKWGRKEWIGKIYPEKTREQAFLNHYVQHYNSIELNATHYKIYDATTITKWVNQAKEAANNFLFCPKMYQGVTHFGNLLQNIGLSNVFLENMQHFGAYLGPIFIQFSESFSGKRQKELFGYLNSLPSSMQFFVELRHNDWFLNTPLNGELIAFLTEKNIGLVITDAAGKRNCAHMQLTTPTTMIRFVGNSLHSSDYTRIDDWVTRMRYWLDNGMREVFFFMHMHDETYSPELTVYLAQKMQAMGYPLEKIPQFIQKPPEQILLF